jgi:hypothetical protein
VRLMMFECQANEVLPRFSQLISSTQPPPLRPASTSLRYDSIATFLYQMVKKLQSLTLRRRTLSQLPDLSSWMSSAQAASPSPPSSRTPKQSSSALDVRPFCANRPVERLDSPKAAPSEESRLSRLLFLGSVHVLFINHELELHLHTLERIEDGDS